MHGTYAAACEDAVVVDGAAEASDPRAAFRESVLDAGLLLDAGVDGLYLRSDTFERVAIGVDRVIAAAGADLQPTVVHFPLVMARAPFERSGYLRSFPDLVGVVEVFRGDDATHAQLLERLDAGRPWADLLEQSDIVLCSAACHPLYPHCSGTLPPGGRRFEVYGSCFRNEPSIDLARMQAFRQHEFVAIGSPTFTKSHRDEWVERGLGVLASLGIEAEPVVANDPFFGRAGRLLAASQRVEVLKYELVYTIVQGSAPTALVSANCHLDHFGAPFGIETDDGAIAHSACVGFGTERIVLALLATHGLDTDKWSDAVRTRLGL
jgi:seryl-tRNA synthetase